MSLHRALAAGGIALGLLAAVPSFAAVELTLYKGETAASQGINLGSWGSGYAAESQKVFMTGTNSIELHTDGYYAGGRLDYTTPVDMTDAFSDPNNYLVIQAKYPGVGDEGDDIGGASAAPTASPGGGYGGGYGGTGGNVPGQGATTQTEPKMGFFRVEMVINGIKLITEDQPVDVSKTESGWTPLSVPLSAFKGNKPTAGRMMMTRLVIFGDRPDTFNVGDIHTSIDDADIFLDEQPDEQTVSPGDNVLLAAKASGGLANVEYVWDFDKSDGLQNDGYGASVYHAFNDLGEYTVTLRVRDINGVKPELREEFKITVAL